MITVEDPVGLVVAIYSEQTGFRGKGVVSAVISDEVISDERFFCIALTEGGPLQALTHHSCDAGRYWFLQSELMVNF